MKKLFKFKEWLTLEAAAKHLSGFLEEPVEVFDVLQLALDGHLMISVNLVNHAYAKLGKVIPYRQVQKHEVPLFDDKGKAILPGFENLRGEDGKRPAVGVIAQGLCIDTEAELTDETPYVVFSDEVTSIDGVWDLAMLHNERLDIEYLMLQKIDGPSLDLVSLNGTYLNRSDGTWAELQAEFDEKTLEPKGERPQDPHKSGDREEERKGTKKDPSRFYPAGGLPFKDGALLVVRVEALRKFEIENGQVEPLARPFYMDPSSPCFPPLLSPAMRAWEEATKGSTRTPKMRIADYLKEHHPDLSGQSREAIAHVFNWGRSGGRPAARKDED